MTVCAIRGPGGVCVAADIRGGEKEAFEWLNVLELIHLTTGRLECAMPKAPFGLSPDGAFAFLSV